MKILFVCLGNICRSPLAEYRMRDLIDKAGVNIQTFSAGIGSWHIGEFMHPRSAERLKNDGIFCDSFRAQQIKKSDIDQYDFIAVMDDQNLKDVEKLWGKNPRVFKLTDFCPQYQEVPDPYYNGNFAQTDKIIIHCCTEWFNKLQMLS